MRLCITCIIWSVAVLFFHVLLQVLCVTLCVHAGCCTVTVTCISKCKIKIFVAFSESAYKHANCTQRTIKNPVNIPYRQGNQNVFCCTHVWPWQVFLRARLDGRWHCCQQHEGVPAFLCNPALPLFYKNTTDFDSSTNININCGITILPLYAQP